MRIAFIAPPADRPFGQERAAEDSMALLKNSHHETFVFSLQGLSEWHSLSNPLKVTQAVLELLKGLKSFRPDVVNFVEQFDFRIMRKVASSYPSLLTAHTVAPTCPASHRLIYRQEICSLKSGISCLLHQRNYGCLRHFKNDLHKLNAVQNYLLKRYALHSFQGIIAISKYVEDTLARDGFSSRKIFQVYNPVFPLKSEPLSDAPKNLIVTASRLVELKGIEFTLRALKEIEDESWTFWILGSGPEKTRLEALVEHLQLKSRVVFKGHVSREETLRAFSSSIFVTQTNVGPEGFGLSVAEAQSLAKPVVSFNVPAINEIVVHGETGFLVSPKDIEELSQAMRKLIRDPGLRSLMGAQAKEQVLRVFSPELHLAKTLQAYEVCLNSWASFKRSDERSISISAT